MNLMESAGRDPWLSIIENAGRQGDPCSDPRFCAWFGNSRVVDAAGHPLVVFHGTNQTFTKFSKKRGGMATGPQAGASKAFFFTNTYDEAMDYAQHAGRKVIANVSAFEKQAERLRTTSERLDQVAQRTGRREDWDAYERAHAAWESYEIDATREDATTNVQVISVYLAMQNPLEVNFQGGFQSEAGDIEHVVATALRQGHDGAILRNISDSPSGGWVTDQYVVFSPKQIRRV